MLETYENWLGLENNRVCYASETHEVLPGTALLSRILRFPGALKSTD